MEDSININAEFRFQKEHLIALMEHGSTEKNVIDEFKNVTSPIEFAELFATGVNFKHILNAAKNGCVSDKDILDVDGNLLNKCLKKRSTSNLNLNPQETRVIFNATVNLNKILERASSAGIVIVNISSEDILEANVDLILGLTWQIIRMAMLKEVSLQYHPELIRLINDNESLEKLSKLSDEQLLVRWLNYHLKISNIKNVVSGLNTKCLGDGWVLLQVFKSVVPVNEVEALKLVDDVLNNPCANSEDRLKCYIDACYKIDCKFFFTLTDLLSRGNRVFTPAVATLFNKYTGIYIPSETKIKGWLGNIQTLETELESTKKELMAKTEEVNKLRSTCSELNSTLDSKKLSLQKTGVDLDSIKEELDSTKEELDSTKKELDSAKEELNSNKEIIEAQNMDVISTIKAIFDNLVEEYQKLDDNAIDIDTVLRASKARLATHYGSKSRTSGSTLNTVNESKSCLIIRQEPTPDTNEPATSDEIPNSQSPLISTHAEVTHEPPPSPTSSTFQTQFDYYIELISSAISKLISLSNSLQVGLSSSVDRLNKIQSINDVMSLKICEYTETRMKSKKR